MIQLQNEPRDDPEDIRFIFNEKFNTDFFNFQNDPNFSDEPWKKNFKSEKCFENEFFSKSDDFLTTDDIVSVNTINNDEQANEKKSSLPNDYSEMANNSCDLSQIGN